MILYKLNVTLDEKKKRENTNPGIRCDMSNTEMIMFIVQIFKEFFRLNAFALENIFHCFFVCNENDEKKITLLVIMVISSITVSIC